MADKQTQAENIDGMLTTMEQNKLRKVTHI
jgi:hypothetical protein